MKFNALYEYLIANQISFESQKDIDLIYIFYTYLCILSSFWINIYELFMQYNC